QASRATRDLSGVVERTPWRGPSSPAGLASDEEKAPFAGAFDGRYWGRTSDPQLVDLAQPFARSRPFAYTAWLREIISSTVRSSEPERTPGLAILATGRAGHEHLIAAS